MVAVCTAWLHPTVAGALDFDGVHRATPHIFSRFSFYASAGKLMVVDVQGVGNIFTDPQVTYGCSLQHLRLQPIAPTVAAYSTYFCS